MQTKLAKSISDASMHQIKAQPGCKAHNVILATDSEKRSTLTSSPCLQKTGPSGLSGLGVRHWVCAECGARRIQSRALHPCRTLQGTTPRPLGRGDVNDQKMCTASLPTLPLGDNRGTSAVFA